MSSIPEKEVQDLNERQRTLSKDQMPIIKILKTSFLVSVFVFDDFNKPTFRSIKK